MGLTFSRQRDWTEKQPALLCDHDNISFHPAVIATLAWFPSARPWIGAQRQRTPRANILWGLLRDSTCSEHITGVMALIFVTALWAEAITTVSLLQLRKHKQRV